jgi:hypothetical protein
LLFCFFAFSFSFVYFLAFALIYVKGPSGFSSFLFSLVMTEREEDIRNEWSEESIMNDRRNERRDEWGRDAKRQRQIYSLDELNEVIRNRTGQRVRDLRPKLDDVPPKQKGSSNYVVPVPAETPEIAVRVSIDGAVSPDSLEHEIECARATGVAMESIWSGLVRFDDAVCEVSCWPWATPIADHVRAMGETKRAEFARKVQSKLVEMSRACVYVDVKAENVMVRDDEPVVIDFDPFFTRRVDERSTERSRAAARGFVPVAMMLLSCSMESRGLALFDPRDIARAARDTGRGPRDVVDRLAVACDRVVECFPDIGAALMGVMQKYVPFWIAKGPLTDAERSALRRVSRMADDWCALRRIESKGLYGAHVRAFIGLAMRSERGPFWAAFAKLEEVAMYTETDETDETDDTDEADEANEANEANETNEAHGTNKAEEAVNIVCESPWTV